MCPGEMTILGREKGVGTVDTVVCSGKRSVSYIWRKLEQCEDTSKL